MEDTLWYLGFFGVTSVIPALMACWYAYLSYKMFVILKKDGYYIFAGLMILLILPTVFSIIGLAIFNFILIK